MKGPRLGTLHYECPRCGDDFECSTEDELFLATTHRLLHLAGEWKQSLRPAAYWALDEIDSSRPQAPTSNI